MKRAEIGHTGAIAVSSTSVVPARANQLRLAKEEVALIRSRFGAAANEVRFAFDWPFQAASGRAGNGVNELELINLGRHYSGGKPRPARAVVRCRCRVPISKCACRGSAINPRDSRTAAIAHAKDDRAIVLCHSRHEKNELRWTNEPGIKGFRYRSQGRRTCCSRQTRTDPSSTFNGGTMKNSMILAANLFLASAALSGAKTRGLPCGQALQEWERRLAGATSPTGCGLP